MKNFILYLICTLLAVVVNFKIYDFYSNFESTEAELLERTRNNVAGLLTATASENEKKLADLVMLKADRKLEINLVRCSAYIIMALSTVLILAVPAAQQLTRRSKPTAKAAL